MEPAEVPDELVARFRARAGQRLEKAEAAWTALIGGSADVERDSVELRRELHTLKGDASTVGFTDVHLLCHKLEDLVAVAHRRGYRVPDDLDIVATMGFRFAGLLCRKAIGRSLGGIDLAGFVAQLDQAMRDVDAAPPVAAAPARRDAAESEDRLSSDARRLLLAAATDAWLEAQNAEGASRRRLLDSSAALCALLASIQGCTLTSAVERHVQAAAALGRELGKDVRAVLDMEPFTVAREVADAADTAVLHLVRNAVDHGIEYPSTREGAGKARAGRIHVGARLAAGTLELEVTDDGSGIDFDGVRRLAVETGVLPGDANHDRLLELLFSPGFTTRAAATASSGRGIGLDAVRDAVTRAGGAISVRSEKGRGASFRITFPRGAPTLDVHRFASASGGLTLAVTRDWEAVAGPGTDPSGIDPLVRLGVRNTEARPGRTLTFRRRGVECALRASSTPAEDVAQSLAPTDDSRAAELVLIGGSPALLLRPERLTVATGRMPHGASA